jgi:hypothetical protein
MMAAEVEVAVVVSTLAVLWQPGVRWVVREWLVIPVGAIVFRAVQLEEMGMEGTGDVEGVVGDLFLLVPTLLLLY